MADCMDDDVDLEEELKKDKEKTTNSRSSRSATKSKSTRNAEVAANYNEKATMTASEIAFYKKLKDIFDKEYIVQFQIPLSSVIAKTSEHRYQNELYRIVDFALLSKDNYKPVILIELNDPSHNEPRRQYRDIKVKELCAKAGIKLLTFWTSYENKPEYIEKRIRQEIDRL